MHKPGTFAETVNDELKNVCNIEYTRRRSIDNFASNLVAGLITYNLMPKKPPIDHFGCLAIGGAYAYYPYFVWRVTGVALY